MTVSAPESGVSRRGFLEALGATSLGAALSGAAIAKTAVAAAAEEPISGKRMGKKGILYDASTCIGCHYCEEGCKKHNDLSCDVTVNILSLVGPKFPKEMLPDVYRGFEETYTPAIKDDRDAERWLRVTENSKMIGEATVALNMRHACTHCGLCAEVCPSGAIRMHEEGAVTVDPTRCIGCKYCYQACPFDIPRYRDKEKYGDAGMQKCSMCYERQNRWKTPGCVQSCPTGALVFGVYEDLVEEGRKRVAALKAAGYEKASLYGEKELGGLGVMYVLPLTRKNYGLPYLPKG